MSDRERYFIRTEAADALVEYVNPSGRPAQTVEKVMQMYLRIAGAHLEMPEDLQNIMMQKAVSYMTECARLQQAYVGNQQRTEQGNKREDDNDTKH